MHALHYLLLYDAMHQHMKSNALVNQTFDRIGLGLDSSEGRVVERRLASKLILNIS